MALNRARVAQDITLTSDLSFSVVVEFFDIAVPDVVLWAETFTVSINATVAQLQAVVTARGQKIRSSLAALDAARVAVPNTTVVTIP